MKYSHQGTKIEDLSIFLRNYFNVDSIDQESSIIELDKIEDLKEKLNNSFNLSKIADHKKKLEEKEKIKEKIEEYKKARKTLKQKEEKMKSIDIRLEKYERLLESVSDIRDKLITVDSELQKFGDLAVSKDTDSRAKTIKYRRIEVILQALQSIKSIVAKSKVEKKSEKKNSTSRNFYPLFFLFVLIQGGGTIWLFTQTNSVLILLLTSLFLLINSFIYFLLIFIKAKDEASFEVNHSESRLGYESIVNEFDENEDMFLVNAAWVRALKREKASLEKQVNSQLKEDGENIHSLTERIASLKQEKRELESLDEGSIISPNEYLKLRREFDILEIELENEEAIGSLPPLVLTGINKVSSKTSEHVYNVIQELVNLGVLKQYVLLETQ